MHSTPNLPKVMTFPECNKTDNDWCIRKPTDPPPFDPKTGKLLELFKEEDPTLGPTFPIKGSGLQH